MDPDELSETEDVSFEEMGLDPRILRSLSKFGISKPTLVQLKSIPLVMDGKDIVARAKTGSGKTLAYLLPIIHKILTSDMLGQLQALILVPTRELCQQVRDEASRMAELCGGATVVQLCTGMNHEVMNASLKSSPDIVVATPGRLAACLKEGLLSPQSFNNGLSFLVMDEADLLLSYGYEDDVKNIIAHIPRSCQRLLMSATTSSDIEKLKSLVLQNPVTLTLTESEHDSESGGGIPSTVKQFKLSCPEKDKFLFCLALLKLGLVQKKVLIFVGSIDLGFKLRLFLEQFGLRSAVLNSELPINSRLHVLQSFNKGLFDYVIATDEGSKQVGRKDSKQSKSKKRKKKSEEEAAEEEDPEDAEREAGGGEGKGSEQTETGEFGVVRGIDFKGVNSVINFSLPAGVTSYVHRVGRTGRAGNAGTSISLVSATEASTMAKIELELSSSSTVGTFPLLSQPAVEALRYRAEDVIRGVTRVKVREARAKELRLEMLNSERLLAHFEDNPQDKEILQHDKVLSRTAPAPHLKMVPGYLRDPTTDAMARDLASSKQSQGSFRARTKKKKISVDPLKTFSFRGKARNEDEPPEVAAALAGTLWARKKQKEKSKRGAQVAKDKSEEKRKAENVKLGKFQNSKKHKRRKR